MSYDELARVYDSFAYDFDYDAWTQWYLKLITDKRNILRDICDCGCGTGSIAIRLARKGYRVTGLDLSESMLAEAQRKAMRAGVKIPFIRQDMRLLCLAHKVDAVICACDGVNYLPANADVNKFFGAVWDNLKQGGVFAFDISNYAKLNDSGLYGEDLEDKAYLWQNEFDSEKQTLNMKLSLFVKEEDGRYARYTEEHTQKAYRVDEIVEMLKAHSFEEITVFGSDEGDSEGPGGKRIYFSAVKA